LRFWIRCCLDLVVVSVLVNFIELSFLFLFLFLSVFFFSFLHYFSCPHS
jgi:hypothetical protein